MNSNDNQNNQETEQPKRRRYSDIFSTSADDDFDANGKSEFRESEFKVVEPQFETVIVDGDEYDFEITPETTNEVTEGTTKMVNAKELKKGMTVRILDHTWYDFSTPTIGTLVNPVERPYRGKRLATVHAVYVDRMEDEHGNPVNQYTIETTEGVFEPEQLEIVE